MNKTIKTATWLPLFDGFYGSWWDDDNQEEMVVEGINEQRKEKGLPLITWADCEWDYTQYYAELSKKITFIVSEYLIKHNFIVRCSFEKLSSPKEYNFRNDSIDVIFTLTPKNQLAIDNYLVTNLEAFKNYIKDHYTSYSGFISSYSNDVGVWLNDDHLTHDHKLGAVLDFIIRHHLENEEGEAEMQVWLYEYTRDICLDIKNYTALMEAK